MMEGTSDLLEGRDKLTEGEIDTPHVSRAEVAEGAEDQPVVEGE